MAAIYRLNATDNRTFVLIVEPARTTLRTDHDTIIRRTLANVLHILGGIIPWEEWSDDTRAVLLHLNNGRGSI